MIARLLSPLTLKIGGGVIALLALLLAVQSVRVASLKGDVTAARASTAAERSAHQQTIANVRAASASAQAAAERDKARIEAAWTARLEEARHENTRLAADYRRRVADFLRAQAPADTGGSGGAGLPDAAALPAGPMHDAAYALVPVADLELTADAFAQLEALIAFSSGLRRPAGE